MPAKPSDTERFWPNGHDVPDKINLSAVFEALEVRVGHDRKQREFAEKLDELDPLRHLKDCFHTPTLATLEGVHPDVISQKGADSEGVYLCGNSLGLQPKMAQDLVQEEMRRWRGRAVQGHLGQEEPWVTVGERLQEDMAAIVGAQPEEVVAMNSLTVNLHVLMVPFYRPTPARHRIMLETKAFPSDHYVALSQARLHGYDDSALLLVEGGTEEVLRALEDHGSEVAVLLLGGVQYYTGLLQDMQTITAAAHRQGCVVGWDLAHAVGNVELNLHDWGVDFAAWCSYKYLNSGPGGVAGAFVHSKHHSNETLPRLLGWWGHDLKTRFDMTNEFVAQPGAMAYAMSCPGVLACASLRASVAVFRQTSMAALRAKSAVLTAYLEMLLDSRIDKNIVKVITPTEPGQRGAQLSLLLTMSSVDSVFQYLVEQGVVVDVRRPGVLRVAPAPLYNTFHQVWSFVDCLQAALAVQ